MIFIHCFKNLRENNASVLQWKGLDFYSNNSHWINLSQRIFVFDFKTRKWRVNVTNTSNNFDNVIKMINERLRYLVLENSKAFNTKNSLSNVNRPVCDSFCKINIWRCYLVNPMLTFWYSIVALFQVNSSLIGKNPRSARTASYSSIKSKKSLWLVITLSDTPSINYEIYHTYMCNRFMLNKNFPVWCCL